MYQMYMDLSITFSNEAYIAKKYLYVAVYVNCDIYRQFVSFHLQDIHTMLELLVMKKND